MSTSIHTKKLIINAFVESCSGHQSPGLWQHPEDQSWKFNELSHWVELAKLLEGGKFHGIFIADVLVCTFYYTHWSYLTCSRGHTMFTKGHVTGTLLSFQALSGQ
jgi:hypothetical protein